MALDNVDGCGKDGGRGAETCGRAAAGSETPPQEGATEESRGSTHFDPFWLSTVDTLRGTKLQFASALTERFTDVGPKWVRTAFGTLLSKPRSGTKSVPTRSVGRRPFGSRVAAPRTREVIPDQILKEAGVGRRASMPALAPRRHFLGRAKGDIRLTPTHVPAKHAI